MKSSRILLLASFLFAAPVAFASEDTSDIPARPAKSELRGSKVTVPLNMDSPRPIIELEINGKGPFRFVFDTGCEGMVLMDGLAEELHLPVTGKSHMGDPTDPEAIEIDRVAIDTVKIGGATFTDLKAASWDAPTHFSHGSLKTRGIIGLVVMSDFLVTFDFANGRLTLERGELPAADGRDIIDYDIRDHGIPSIPLTLGDVSLSAHIDSGSPGTITVPENLRNRLKFMSEPVIVGHARTVNSSFNVLRATLDGNASIGGHVFEQPNLALISMLNDSGNANIGSALLRQFEVTFDQKNTRVRFANRTKTASALGSNCGHVVSE